MATMMMMSFIPVTSGGATPGHAGSNHLDGRSTALAPPCLLLCFASVTVWTKTIEKYHIRPLTTLFVLFWQWNNLSGVGGLSVLRATTKKRKKKVVNFFGGKKYIRVTWLEDVLTSKWPGSFAALAPPQRVTNSSSFSPPVCFWHLCRQTWSLCLFILAFSHCNGLRVCRWSLHFFYWFFSAEMRG